MKNKLLLVIAIAVIVIGIVVFFLLGRKEANFEIEDDYIITYTYGGGFGPYIDTVNKTIELDNNGNVLIYANIRGKKELKEYKVSNDDIDELATEMIHGRFSRLDSDLIESYCYDASSSSLSIKYRKYEKEVYNYCKYNEVYHDAVDKFLDIVDRDKVEAFEDYLWDKYNEEES